MSRNFNTKMALNSLTSETCPACGRAKKYKQSLCRRLITYILSSESGVSLAASGWKQIGECGGGTWNRQERPRVDMHPTQGKIRFEMRTE